MVSTASAYVKQEGKKRGKRRAVSPVASDNSTDRAEWACVQSILKGLESTKRLKREPNSDSEPITAEDIEQNVRRLTAEHDQPARGRSLEAGGIPSANGKASPHDESKGDTLSALLPILIKAPAVSGKAFHGALDDLLDTAFHNPTNSNNTAPGLPFLECILSSLRDMDAPVSRINHVESFLRQGWRRRMARYVGENVTSSDELREMMNTIVAALPWRPGHHGFALPLPSDTIQATDAATSTNDHCDSDNSILAVPRAVKPSSGRNVDVLIQPSQGEAHKLGDETPTTPASKSKKQSRRSNKRNRKEAQEPGDRTKDDRPGPETLALNPVKPDIELRQVVERVDDKKLGSFDAFFLCVEQSWLNNIGHQWESLGEAEAFRERVRALYDSLAAKEQQGPKKSHKKLLKGEIRSADADESKRMLDEHGIWAKLKNDKVIFRPREVEGEHVSRARGAVRQEILPLLIKSVRTNKAVMQRGVMLVLDTPSMPEMEYSPDRILQACRSSFAQDYRPLRISRVEKWSPHIWVVFLETDTEVQRATHRTIQLNGVAVRTERLNWSRQSMFVCDDYRLEQDEVSYRVAQTFAERREGLKLFLQDKHKIYGRQWLVKVPDAADLVRFYVPMFIGKTVKVTMACFKPILSKGWLCPICGDDHLPKPCPHAVEILLPSAT